MWKKPENRQTHAFSFLQYPSAKLGDSTWSSPTSSPSVPPYLIWPSSEEITLRGISCPFSLTTLATTPGSSCPADPGVPIRCERGNQVRVVQDSVIAQSPCLKCKAPQYPWRTPCEPKGRNHAWQTWFLPIAAPLLTFCCVPIHSGYSSVRLRTRPLILARRVSILIVISCTMITLTVWRLCMHPYYPFALKTHITE